MDIKPRWRLARAVPLPATTSTLSGLTAHHLGADPAVTLGLAALAGLIGLAAIAIREHAATRRAELPYKAEHMLARAEARNRSRYARAQTRRSKPLPGCEHYRPDSATDLAEIVRVVRGPTVVDPSVNSTKPPTAPESPSRAPRNVKPTVRRPEAAA
jgi:hypothetical protein